MAEGGRRNREIVIGEFVALEIAVETARSYGLYFERDNVK